MNDHHHDEGFCGHGPHGHGPHGGHGGHGPRGHMPPFAKGMHAAMAGHLAMRMRRGDVRPAILRLLSEQPMHGYQIIQELSARSGGAWAPSAGSVYPTLQQLADEGLIVSEETGGKKVFSLTEAGTAAVADTAGQPAPWEDAASSNSDATEYRQAAAKLAQAMFQVGRGGSATQTAAAVEVLNDARKKLYAILAED